MKPLLLALSLLRHDPYISKDAPGVDTCADSGAFRGEPCPGRKLELTNPTKRTAVVAVRCARDPRTDLEAVLPPRGHAFLSIGISRPLAAGECVVFRIWYR